MITDNDEVRGSSLMMNDLEIKAFNDRWTRYEGEKRTGADVNALIIEAISNNLKYNDDDIKCVVIKVYEDNELVVKIDKDTDTDKSPKKVQTGNRYNIKCIYNTNTQLINEIICEKTEVENGT